MHFVICLLLPIVCLAHDGFKKAETLFEEGKWNEAKNIIRKALDEDPNNSKANSLLGRIYYKQKNLDEAQKYLENAVELAPKNVQLQLYLSFVYRDRARSAGFINAIRLAGKWKDLLENAFEIDPSHIEVRRQLITYLLNAPWIGGGDKDRAKELAEATIAINEIEGRLLLAYAYNKMDEVEEAVNEYKKVLKLDAKRVSVFISMGYMFLKKEEYDLAEKNFKKYIELLPNDANAYDSMGDYYIKREMPKKGIVQFQKALEIDPKFSASRFKLAKAYQEFDPGKAIYHYEKLIELTPGHYNVEKAKENLEDLID